MNDRSLEAAIIDGKARPIREMLHSRKYGLDFYQREYTWEENNIVELLNDLSSAFLAEYDPSHERKRVASYRPYFLGTVVTSLREGTRYLVDGQQRLTTLTLLLIHLHHLTAGREGSEDLSPLVYSFSYGEKSFNLDVPERLPVMDAILHDEDFDPVDATESPRNIWARYQNIIDLFPDELAGEALLHFIDWLLNRVVLVEIVATDQDMAVEIFETMNDRGLQLSNADMLKSYLIARIGEPAEIAAANKLWRKRVGELNELERNADAEFMKVWLRGKYAETIRERTKDAAPRDFDKIGTGFHKWVRDNKGSLGLTSPTAYTQLVNKDFSRLAQRYGALLQATQTYNSRMSAVFYNGHTGVTLQYLPIMAAVTPDDDEDTFVTKAQLIASYLDLMVARRMVNYRNFGYSTISYSVFNLAKDLRDKDIDDIKATLADRVAGLEEDFTAVERFALTQRNRSHVAYLLARMTDWVEQGSDLGFAEYVSVERRHRFEVEHIWANHPERHTDEFADARDFADHRNRFGDLLLLPKDFNASYGDMTYDKKLPHYFGQNILAKSLHPNAYVNNPTFLSTIERYQLAFTPYPESFTASDIDERQALYRTICEHVWDPDRLGIGGGTAPTSARDYYVSFGDDDTRNWEDARAHGFITAGGGSWYARSLTQLSRGDRVFAYMPGTGYIGVGTVTQPAIRAAELLVTVDGEPRPLRDAPVRAPGMWRHEGDASLEEYAVGVDWISTRPTDQAIWDAELFSNSNIVCRLRHEPTRQRLATEFGLVED